MAGVVHANEYVVPAWLRKDPEVARVEEWLEAKRQRGSAPNSYAEGGRVSSSQALSEGEGATYSGAYKNVFSNKMEETMERLTDVLEKLEKQGVDAYIISDAKNGKELQKALKLYQELKDKNKH